jgi:hypothetical protein
MSGDCTPFSFESYASQAAVSGIPQTSLVGLQPVATLVAA